MKRAASAILYGRIAKCDRQCSLPFGIVGAILATSAGCGLVTCGQEGQEAGSNFDLHRETDKSRSRWTGMSIFRPAKTSLQAESTTWLKGYASRGTKTSLESVDYDFVVLGNGNAGRSAVQTLQEQCPTARIALVDPLRPTESRSRQLDYYACTAVGFVPSARTVKLLDASKQLRYRHSLLVATGCRGAPPPMSLIDDNATDRIIELRATEVAGTRRRPVVPPHTVRHLTLMAASQGATVCIMGSGWEAVELAVAASEAGSGPPILTFGSAGPLSHIVPRYLSTEVARRLRQQGITTLERSLVRYVAADIDSEPKRLEIHTARSYDLLDSTRSMADLLVIAPYVKGGRGTATLPTSPSESSVNRIEYDQPRYKTWSQSSGTSSSPSSVVCFSDDGRILVNAELAAASRVYAAGSVAKFPSSVTGHAHVAGEGAVDGALAGRLASMQMARDYNETRSGKWIADENTSLFAGESLSVWRSDICTFLPEEKSKQNTLERIGVHALCIGNCDSERLATHGYWWTNRRLLEPTGEGVNVPSRTVTRRRKTRASSQMLPVFGTGVVFYVDNAGHVRGIMTWGLPFASLSRTDAELNQELVSKMRGLIGSNGGVSPLEFEDESVLRRHNLMDESKTLVGIALSRKNTRRDTTRSMKKLRLRIQDMGIPLYRYTSAKPPKIFNIGVLRRNDHSRYSHLMGENLYVKDDDDTPDLMPRATKTQKSDPIVNARLNQIHEELLDQALYENETRARPPKEEPLWLRRGDAHKGISLRERMADNIIRNVRKGRFADGTDSVQQARAPRSFQTAKDNFRKWTTQANRKWDDEEDE